jgi:hypothetical protein
MLGSALTASRPSVIVDSSDQFRCSAGRPSRPDHRAVKRCKNPYPDASRELPGWPPRVGQRDRRVLLSRSMSQPARSRARAVSATPRAAGQVHSGDAEDHEGGTARPGSPAPPVVPRAPPGRGRRRRPRSGRRPPAAAAGPRSAAQLSWARPGGRVRRHAPATRRGQEAESRRRSATKPNWPMRSRPDTCWSPPWPERNLCLGRQQGWRRKPGG